MKQDDSAKNDKLANDFLEFMEKNTETNAAEFGRLIVFLTSMTLFRSGTSANEARKLIYQAVNDAWMLKDWEAKL